MALLAELRDLAVHQGKRAVFDVKLAQVIAAYAGLAALHKDLTAQPLAGRRVNRARSTVTDSL